VAADVNELVISRHGDESFNKHIRLNLAINPFSMNDSVWMREPFRHLFIDPRAIHRHVGDKNISAGSVVSLDDKVRLQQCVRYLLRRRADPNDVRHGKVWAPHLDELPDSQFVGDEAIHRISIEYLPPQKFLVLRLRVADIRPMAQVPVKYQDPRRISDVDKYVSEDDGRFCREFPHFDLRSLLSAARDVAWSALGVMLS
jgi:hypothetical protein